MKKKMQVICMMMMVCSLCACNTEETKINEGKTSVTTNFNTTNQTDINKDETKTNAIKDVEGNETIDMETTSRTDAEATDNINMETTSRTDAEVTDNVNMETTVKIDTETTGNIEQTTQNGINSAETESTTKNDLEESSEPVIELETYLDINTIPIEKSVEIKDNKVIQCSPVSGWGYQTTEFIYENDTLQSVKVTALSVLAITEEDYQIFKQNYETMGYTNIKKEEVYKITAECKDLSKSDFWSYVNYSKENLKKKLLGEEIEEEIPTVAHQVAWEDIKYIPEGMPKLADFVSDDLSNPIGNGFSVVFNELAKDDMEEMRKKLEQWSGTVFSKPSNQELIVYLVNTDKMMMSIYYYITQQPKEPQCSITVSIYK